MDLKFVHTSDWHLGFSQYNKTERFDDFFIAVERTVDKIIELSPDFIIHTGDLFHDPRPTPAAIRQAIIILQKLEEAKIPTYVIRGNHDGRDSIYLSRGGGIITLLKELDLLHYVNDRSVDLQELGCQIIGIGYYPGKGVVKKIDEIIKDTEVLDDKTKFTILALHAFVEGQLEEYAQVSLQSIADLGIDYIAAGHYHKPWMNEEKRIYAPGSSETTAISDATRDDIINEVSMYSSFYEIHVTKGENSWSQPIVISHKIPVRPKILVNYETASSTVDTIKKELDKILDEKIDTILLTESSLAEMRPILQINLTTELDFEENSRILIENWYEDEYLHIITNIDGKSNQTEILEQLRTSHQIEDVFVDLLKMHNLDEQEHLSKLIDLTTEFAEYPPSRELNAEDLRTVSDIIQGGETRLGRRLQEEIKLNKEKTDEADKQKKTKKKKRKKKEKEDLTEISPIEGTEDHQLGLDIFDEILKEEDL